MAEKDLADYVAGMSLTNAGATQETVAAAGPVAGDGMALSENGAAGSVVDSVHGGSSIGDAPELVEEVHEYLASLGYTLMVAIVRAFLVDDKKNPVLKRWLLRETNQTKSGRLGVAEWQLYEQWLTARKDDNPKLEASALRKQMRVELCHGF